MLAICQPNAHKPCGHVFICEIATELIKILPKACSYVLDVWLSLFECMDCSELTDVTAYNSGYAPALFVDVV